MEVRKRGLWTYIISRSLARIGDKEMQLQRHGAASRVKAFFPLLPKVMNTHWKEGEGAGGGQKYKDGEKGGKMFQKTTGKGWGSGHRRKACGVWIRRCLGFT